MKEDLLDSGEETIEEGIEFLGELSESTRLGTNAGYSEHEREVGQLFNIGMYLNS